MRSRSWPTRKSARTSTRGAQSSSGRADRTHWLATRPSTTRRASTGCRGSSGRQPPNGISRFQSALPLRRRGGYPVVAERAQLIRGLRLEALLEDALRDLGDRPPHPLELLLGVGDRHLLPLEHVQIALRRGRQVPRLARSHLVERELHVLAQFLGGLRFTGLVVDQLVAALGKAVDAVDAPAHEVRAEAEGERALEPHRVAGALALGLPVALERGHRAGPELAVVGAVTEAGTPPRGIEDAHELVERTAALGVVALEHLVQDDSEALIDRRLLGHAEDARELVLERAQPVGLDVGGREHEALAAARQEALERGLGAAAEGLGAAALVALALAQVVVERRGLE